MKQWQRNEKSVRSLIHGLQILNTLLLITTKVRVFCVTRKRYQLVVAANFLANKFFWTFARRKFHKTGLNSSRCKTQFLTESK